MKTTRVKMLAGILVLVAVSLACGSDSGVTVNAPSDNTAAQPEPAQAEPTATTAVGTSRSNPAPAGSEVVVDDLAFVVKGNVKPATDIVMSGNMFNTEPEEGQEYILVEVQVTCQKSSDEQCNLSLFNISVLGSAGIQRDAEWLVVGVDGLLEGGDFYGGAVLSGYVPFIVGTDEIDLLLVYEPFFGDTFYLEIE